MTTTNAARFHERLTYSILGEDLFVPPPSEHGKARASVVGSGCLRKVQYVAYGVPPSELPTESGRLATNAGMALEKLAKRWIRNMPDVMPLETSQLEDSTAPITATPDMVILWNDNIHVVEIKFMGYYRFSDLLKAGDIREAHASYYWQCVSQLLRYPCAVSALFVAFPLDYGAVKGKANMRPKKGELPPAPPPVKFVQEIVRLPEDMIVLEEVANVVRDNDVETHLLPRGYRPGATGEKPLDWQCAYCDHLEICRADGDGT